jgi:hypothetical protein
VDDCLEFANEEEGKVWCGCCNESWNLVSSWETLQILTRRSHVLTGLSLYSAGAASIVKTIHLVALSAKADFTCMPLIV